MKIGRYGFTLIELVLVIIIISMLTLLFVNTYKTIADKTTFATAKSHLATLQRQVWLYYTVEGVYPETLDTLVSKGYIKRIPLLDIKYHIPTTHVVISSQPYNSQEDTGKWYYNPISGIVTIACTHKDIDGIEIYKW
ncbi:MAG: prepilin-type N-terminal cleavage/methylation domain-containing protein [Endomicrobia bacterium]|nr:prepilin-type N-terminal cleavage/methylation domain-containing protein [Endomicrobiia bacterium]